MFGLIGSLRMYAFVGLALGAWFIYGWGSEVISNYGNMAKKIERLEHENKLITSRVASYQTLLARRNSAIAASKCKVQIEKWIKDPDLIPGQVNPFKSDSGN